jgi:hypothetical protein
MTIIATASFGSSSMTMIDMPTSGKATPMMPLQTPPTNIASITKTIWVGENP